MAYSIEDLKKLISGLRYSYLPGKTPGTFAMYTGGMKYRPHAHVDLNKMIYLSVSGPKAREITKRFDSAGFTFGVNSSAVTEANYDKHPLRENYERLFGRSGKPIYEVRDPKTAAMDKFTSALMTAAKLEIAAQIKKLKLDDVELQAFRQELSEREDWAYIITSIILGPRR